jgi:hypothetical protein
MTVATTNPTPKIGLASRLVNGLLSIAPLFNIAKQRARKMMIERAESMGVNWLQIAADLQKQDLEAELTQVQNPNLKNLRHMLFTLGSGRMKHLQLRVMRGCVRAILIL